jgi:hypothetical protein
MFILSKPLQGLGFSCMSFPPVKTGGYLEETPPVFYQSKYYRLIRGCELPYHYALSGLEPLSAGKVRTLVLPLKTLQ